MGEYFWLRHEPIQKGIYNCDTCRDTGELIFEEYDEDKEEWFEGVVPCYCRESNHK